MTMNLCAPTNSLQSNIMHASVRGMPDPTVGMGVTILMWTDRTVGTVNVIHSPILVEFTADETTPAPLKEGEEPHMGRQEWVHTPQPDATPRFAMKHKDGRWYEPKLNRWGKLVVVKGCQPLALGRKDYNYDWSF